MSTKRTFVAMLAVEYLRNTHGCAARPGGYHTVSLPNLKQTLVLWLSARYSHFAPRGELDQGLWQEIQEYTNRQNPGYHLVNETVGRLHNGWSPDWLFTNDPARMSGHTRADIHSTVSRFINALPRFRDGTANRHAAGIFHRMGEYVTDMLLLMYEELPLMMTEAINGTATWRSLYDTITDVRVRAGIDGPHGHDIGTVLWDIFSAPSAAAPPIAQVP